MRNTTNLFTINGKPMLLPDCDVSASYTDLDAQDSGRDASGVMHRIPLRYKVGSWGFHYTLLTEEEKRYMESLFPEEATFLFSHPGRLDAAVQEQTVCYRSKYGISWRDARTGLWSGYSFSIIEC